MKIKSKIYLKKKIKKGANLNFIEKKLKKFGTTATENEFGRKNL